MAPRKRKQPASREMTAEQAINEWLGDLSIHTIGRGSFTAKARVTPTP